MKLAALGEICRFEYGASLPDKARELGGVVVYGSNGPVGSHRNSRTSGRTIIVGRKGSIGQVHYSDIPCWPIDTTYFVDETCTTSDLEWLSYALRHLRLDALNKASGVPGLNRDDAYKQKLWVPESNEDQRQVAARLKAQLAEVDTARQAAQAQVRDTKLLCTKLVDAAFAACTQWQHIGAVAKLQSGYAFKSEDFKSSGVRLLRNTNILPGKVYWDDVVCIDTSEVVRYPNYVLAAGDILISLDRPLIASGIKVARVSTDDLPALLLQRVGRFVLKPGLVDPDFLLAFLHSSRFIAAISGHDQSLGVPHISPGQVEAVEFPLLPITEQRKLASRLKSQLAEATAIAQAAAAQLAEIDRLPQRILDQAFAASA